MNFQSLTKYYVRAIKALIFVIPFLSYWIASSMYFPYITGRNFLFRILVELALVLWVGLAVLNKEYRPKFTPIVWAVVIFTAIVGLADFFGVDAYASFWSRFERMEGYLMILHLAAYFFILTNVFRTKKEWLTLFNLVMIAGILVGGYGVLQLLGIKEAIQGGDVRIDGTIGNPTYLAAYLTLVIALSLILFFNAKKSWLKYLYAAVVAFNFFIMFFTASRGAAFAFLISIPLFLILYLVFYRKTEDPKERKLKKIALAALALMMVVPASIWFSRGSSLVQNNAVLSRITSVSFQERTIRSRFQIWGIAWKAFQERPILGWGQENFLEAFSKYYDPRLYDQEPWFDRPHNIVFEWLINAGILGLISYLSLFAALFWGVRKLLKGGAVNKKEGLVLAVVPATYFLQNFFVFDNFNTYVIFFSLLAYVNSLVVNKSSEAPAEQNNVRPSVWAFSSGLLVAAAVIYFINLVPMAQSQGIISALRATTDQTDPIGKTLAAFKKSISYNAFGEAEVLEHLARTSSMLAGQDSIPNNLKAPFLQYAVQRMQDYLDRHPHNIRMHLMFGSLYESMRSLNQQFVFQAREEIKTALALSPNKQQIIFLLADNYIATNEVGKAVELMKQAVALEPSNIEANVNLTIVAILDGNNDLVSKTLENINQLRLNPPDGRSAVGLLWEYAVSLNKIGNIYVRIGQKSRARSIYNRLLSLEPDILKGGESIPEYRALLTGLSENIK